MGNLQSSGIKRLAPAPVDCGFAKILDMFPPFGLDMFFFSVVKCLNPEKICLCTENVIKIWISLANLADLQIRKHKSTCVISETRNHNFCWQYRGLKKTICASVSPALVYLPNHRAIPGKIEKQRKSIANKSTTK